LDEYKFEERAALLEYCDGYPRFQAESIAAEHQGFKRWEVLNEIKRRDSEKERNHREAAQRDKPGDLSKLQPEPKE
jgi:hypothetical protein